MDGLFGAISGWAGGPGKGNKHLMNLGKQTLQRTFDATKHKGIKAGLNEAMKAFAYYGKSTSSYYKTFIKGIPGSFFSSAISSFASSDFMKSNYSRLVRGIIYAA